MRITLTVTEGPHQGRSYTFAEHDTFMIGRAPDAHFCLPEDPYFSRAHFLIEVNPPLCRLCDMNSHNGTKVNGKRVLVADLQDGDEIRAGHTVLRLAVEPAAGEDRPRTLTLSLSASEPVPELAARFPAIPGFRILDILGEGGMGVVYRAESVGDGAVVALKTIRPAMAPADPVVARFMREAQTLRELTHPHIVAFRDVGQVGGLLYFAMDFVPGTDASRLVKKEGPLPVGRAVRLVCQLLEALAFAHGKGVVHRDIKPANLLVAATPEGEMARLADFGLARTYQASQLSGLTLTGSPGGTPRFMPPEQVLDFKTVQPPADQYAAAATLYYLLTAKYLYEAKGPQEVFRQILTADPIPLAQRRADLPAGLGSAIHRALSRRAEDRFEDVAALRNALLSIGVP